MSKWTKRIYKLKGFANYTKSVALLRYTKLNQGKLIAHFKAFPTDRLHVGCGLTLLEGWCNVLYEPRQEYGWPRFHKGALILNYNLLKPWPWPKDSVQFVAGAHFIEHIDLNHCLYFVKEAFKVLKSGGVIRLSCPDLETYARNYIEGNAKFYENPYIKGACTFKAAVTPSQIFAAKAYDSGGAHKWFHDYSSLKFVLEQVGFMNILKLKRLEGQTPNLEELELSEREIETVYVEAVKP